MSTAVTVSPAKSETKIAARTLLAVGSKRPFVCVTIGDTRELHTSIHLTPEQAAQLSDALAMALAMPPVDPCEGMDS